jgi:hypothetical protein
MGDAARSGALGGPLGPVGRALVWLVVTLVPCALACRPPGPTPGERAATSLDAGPGFDAGSRCPAGEHCDSATPYGLAFSGALPAPHLLRPVAAGGREVVRVYRAEQASLGADGWPGPFVAGPTDGSVLGIRGVAEPDVDVLGRREGSALLRIVSPTTNELFDRVSIVVRDVARTTLTTHDAYYAAPGLDVGGIAAWPPEPGPADADPWTLLVAIEDRDGTQLWDDSLRVEGHTMEVYGGCNGTRWCFELPLATQSFQLDARERSAGADLVVTRDAGSFVRHLEPVTDERDAWLVIGGRSLDTGAPLVSARDGDLLVQPSDTSIVLVCAVAMIGAGPVLGAAPTLVADGAASTSSGSCALLSTSTTLTATLGSLRRTVSFVWLPTDDAVIAPQPLVAAPAPFVLGERAMR